jgi:hypothetical protein
MTRVTKVAAVVLALSAVAAGAEDKGAVRQGTTAFTLGLVQKELHVGLSQAEVVERLGAPNILTRDPAGRESWVYDKVSSEVETSSGHVGVGGLGMGAGGSLAGVLGVAVGKRSEKVKSSQNTLTVVVRFSAAGAVEGFSWHASRF